ncbi:hypothetical protein QPM17_12445 [Marinobacter sp. TBZ242]|uniref:Ketopantoate reductase N-terminal domain-containing protein n=1 Tax=Marinobacter azerbaijanicus TaxID=3050455 RepID=A0ABT7ICR1_9GAMM|nr:hypothetical protein [Marinobacter sp. TBZ242]MDL0431946.1 hypothetical protein [Marinobacter sp. TBZ242]
MSHKPSILIVGAGAIGSPLGELSIRYRSLPTVPTPKPFWIRTGERR